MRRLTKDDIGYFVGIFVFVLLYTAVTGTTNRLFSGDKILIGLGAGAFLCIFFMMRNCDGASVSSGRGGR
jgi:hypothetical protein